MCANATSELQMSGSATLQHTLWLICSLLIFIVFVALGARASAPANVFTVATPEDIGRLWRVAIERGEKPTPEGHLFLEYESGGFRQYATLTLAQGLFGGFVGIERIDFIQEKWQANVLDQDDIDQWVVSANASGTARLVWHKHLLEEQGRVLKEEFFSPDEDSAKDVVERIVARFLAPVLMATATPVQLLTFPRTRFLLPVSELWNG